MEFQETLKFTPKIMKIIIIIIKGGEEDSVPKKLKLFAKSPPPELVN